MIVISFLTAWARDVTVMDAPDQPHAFMHFAGRDPGVRGIMDQIGQWMTRVSVKPFS